MELRSLLKSGHSVALGVLALRAVQSALTLAMPTGGDSPPMGWTPIRKLIESARQRGFHTIPPMEVRIDIRVIDRRSGSHDPLPVPGYRSFPVK